MTDRPPPASHHCRHYSYDGRLNGGPRCARGVDLTAPAAAKVCMPNAKEAVACDLREEHTDAERAAWQAWRNERAGRMIQILAEIPGSSRDKKNRPEWGKSGEFPCPACEWGVIRWARAIERASSRRLHNARLLRDHRMTKPGRIPCVVPFCRRTTARADFEQWICGDHWRLIDKRARRVYGRHLRRCRRYGAAAYGPAAARIWRRLTAQAIQRAMGIE